MRSANFAVAKNSQGVTPFPQLAAFRGVLSQQSDQVRQPWKGDDAHAQGERHDRGDEILIQTGLCGEDHRRDSGRHGGDEHDDGSFDPGEIEHKGGGESQQQSAGHTHHDAHNRQGNGAACDSNTEGKAQHEAGQRNGGEVKRCEELAKAGVKVAPEQGEQEASAEGP